MTERYEKLKEALSEMAELLKLFPESLQGAVLETLLCAFQEKEFKKPSKREDVSNEEISRKNWHLDKENQVLRDVARMNDEGRVEIIATDLKTESGRDAIKRLAYIAMRAKKYITGEKEVSWKNDILRLAREFRLYNYRGFISSDGGIKREGDSAWLDRFAKQKAEKFIDDVLNKELTGTWKPGTKRVTKKKSTGDKEKKKDS